jgi:hypothetical protein
LNIQAEQALKARVIRDRIEDRPALLMFTPILPFDRHQDKAPIASGNSLAQKDEAMKSFINDTM